MITKKTCLIGTWGVGKARLVQQFVNDISDDKYPSALGVTVGKKALSVTHGEVTLMPWDIAGGAENFSVPTDYTKGSVALASNIKA